METIAVYWEPVIRVYGFELIKDADLIRLRVPISKIGQLGRKISHLSTTGANFVLTVLQYIDPNWAEICCVMKKEHHLKCMANIAVIVKEIDELTLHNQTDIDVLFFHGPHFQDRYGIVAAAMEVLLDQQTTLHLAGCAGTSIYLIIPGGTAEKTKTALAAAFTIPHHLGTAA